MRFSTLAPALFLSALLVAQPAFAQPADDEPTPEAGADSGTESGDDGSEAGDDGSESGDDTEVTAPENAAGETERKLEAADDEEKTENRVLSAEGEDDADDTEGDDTDADANSADSADGVDDEASDDTEDGGDKPPTVRTEVRSIDNTRVDSAWNDSLDEFNQRYKWRLLVGGYIRAQYTGIQNDPGNGLIGQNDGFILGNARLTLDGSMRDTLGFRFQVDGAVDRNNSPNTASGEVVTRLKDAYLYWTPLAFAGLKVGQFKAPFDVEEQFSTAEILFVDRSVGSRGVQGVEGFNQPGLSVDREVGAELGSAGYYPMASGDEPEGIGLSYGLAVTNGESANRTRNDNDQLAYYGRLALHWGDMVRLGGAYYVNDTLAGEQPDVIEENRSGYTADLTFTAYGVTLVGSFIQSKIETPEVDLNPTETATAYQASIGYREPFLGFQPAVRYAYYDPTDALDNDALTYLTFGLNYLPDYPVRFTVNYTVTTEEEGRELENNRFDAMLQVQW